MENINFKRFENKVFMRHLDWQGVAYCGCLDRSPEFGNYGPSSIQEVEL